MHDELTHDDTSASPHISLGQPLFWLLVGCLIICSLTSAWYAAVIPGPVGLVADRSVHDFGEVWQRSRSETSFTLTNTTKAKIDIVRTVANCSCTGSSVDRTALGPGETANLSVIFNAGAQRGETKTKLVILYRVAGDSHVSSHSVRLAADVLFDYDVSPEDEIAFQERQSGEREIVVRGHQEDFKVLDAYCSHPAFGVVTSADPSSEAAGPIYRVRVRFDADKWSVDSNAPSIVIETTSSYQKTFRLPVNFDL